MDDFFKSLFAVFMSQKVRQVEVKEALEKDYNCAPPWSEQILERASFLGWSRNTQHNRFA